MTETKLNEFLATALQAAKAARELILSYYNGEFDIEMNYRDDAVEYDTDYYYVHIRQEDGEQAWSSPVWVTRLA